ncbi:hypothetical protein UCREL1_311 [Eutypa lata UCREL1]|uniref:Uncharacterized protein n=1 Tax=Eutypa lata (strain UCR-EL1) TaxID=1287681 RepID=M7U128_EUTLA|nr:hypothetical protein UCREL1_311 [Eutypa lata UCREL1]
MGRTASNLFVTLIRTHHITSRKKLQRVKKAAEQCAVPYVLVRSGGSPGIMYAESPDEGRITEWVGTVQSLRYKDFQCARKPSRSRVEVDEQSKHPVFNEVESVAAFGEAMDRKGLSEWWKVGMGYDAGNR